MPCLCNFFVTLLLFLKSEFSLYILKLQYNSLVLSLMAWWLAEHSKALLVLQYCTGCLCNQLEPSCSEMSRTTQRMAGSQCQLPAGSWVWGCWLSIEVHLHVTFLLAVGWLGSTRVCSKNAEATDILRLNLISPPCSVKLKNNSRSKGQGQHYFLSVRRLARYSRLPLIHCVAIRVLDARLNKRDKRLDSFRLQGFQNKW